MPNIPMGIPVASGSGREFSPKLPAILEEIPIVSGWGGSSQFPAISSGYSDG